MEPTQFFLSEIQAAYPDFAPAQGVEHIGEGQFNDVLVVDGAWVFRFPRYAEGARALAGEARLLKAFQALRPNLPLLTPDPLYQRVDPPEPGRAFIGYRRLPGEPLYRVRALDPPARMRAAEQLAGFLRALHSLAPDSLDAPLPLADQPADWERMYEEIRKELFPVMRRDARRTVTQQFEEYLNSAELQTFTPAVRHGDFGGSNLLYDPQARAMTGVLDFSSCALGDPAADLASVATLGAAIFEVIAYYYEPDEAAREPLLERARFYRSTFALSEALDGVKNSDVTAYERGLETYI